MNYINLFVTFCFQLNIISGLNNSKLIFKAISIADSNYDRVSSTSIFWNCSSSEDVSIFLQNYNGSVILSALYKDIIKDMHKVNNFNQTILFASGKEEFKEIMEILEKVIVVPIRIILILTKVVSFADMHIISKIAWENDMSDLVVVSFKQGKVTLSTFFPYNGYTCGDYTSVVIPLDTDVFPKKFQNYYKCPIKAALIHSYPYVMYDNLTLQLSGMHAQIFTTLVNKHNASINVTHTDEFFGVYVNGTAGGLLGSLYYKKADIVLNQAILNDVRYKLIQVTSVFKKLYLNWIGPERQEVQQWMRILRPLMTPASYAVTLTFFIFATVTTVLKSKLLNVKSKQNVFFTSFTIFIGLDVKLEFKSQLLNNLFMLWIFCCMIFRFVYQGNLVDGLQRTVLEAPLTDLDEAIAKIGVYYSGKLFRDELFNGTKYYTNMKIRNFDSEVAYFKDLSDGRRRFLLFGDSYAMKIFPNLQIIGPPRLIFPVCLIMRRGWPAAKEIATTLNRMFESGIIYKIESDYEYDWGRTKKMYKIPVTRPLDMNNYIGCFYALIIMYVICGLVFVIEMINFKFNLSLHRTKVKHFE